MSVITHLPLWWQGDLSTQWLQDRTILKANEEISLECYYPSCSSFSSFWDCSLGPVGCFFLGALCSEVQRCPDYPSNRLLGWKGASSRQKETPSSLTLTLLCLSCLLTPDTSWDNTGTGAKLVTSTYHIRAERCLLTNLCSLLYAFGFLYFFSVSHVLGPNVVLLKLVFLTSEEGRGEVWHCWGPRALEQQNMANFTRTAHVLKPKYVC